MRELAEEPAAWGWGAGSCRTRLAHKRLLVLFANVPNASFPFP